MPVTVERREVPQVAVEFLAAQRFLVVAAVAGPDPGDATAPVWASALFGEPGFVSVPRSDVLHIAAVPDGTDPLAPTLRGAALLGSIAIEPSSRRRSRFNGRSRPQTDGEGLIVELDEVVANCPRYIQQRDVTEVIDVESPASGSGAAAATAELTREQQRWIATADTFFFGTADSAGNADASHRGGNPGFVEVHDPQHFRFPEYPGNQMYLTIDNLAQRPHGGFLFVDWATGALLHVTGTVNVTDAGADPALPGAERIIDVRVERVVERRNASPLRWGDPVASRWNPALAGDPA
jgi:hypothetical protein